MLYSIKRIVWNAWWVEVKAQWWLKSSHLFEIFFFSIVRNCSHEGSVPEKTSPKNISFENISRIFSGTPLTNPTIIFFWNFLYIRDNIEFWFLFASMVKLSLGIRIKFLWLSIKFPSARCSVRSYDLFPKLLLFWRFFWLPDTVKGDARCSNYLLRKPFNWLQKFIIVTFVENEARVCAGKDK